MVFGELRQMFSYNVNKLPTFAPAVCRYQSYSISTISLFIKKDRYFAQCHHALSHRTFFTLLREKLKLLYAEKLRPSIWINRHCHGHAFQKSPAIAFQLYEDTFDKLNYEEYFQAFKLPDTFFSWFLITELHLWMLMVRLENGGRESKEVKYHLVSALWKDVEERSKKLGHIKGSIRRKGIKQLALQFQAALINYDEGLLGSDRDLAASLWRRFFLKAGDDARNLEMLLAYVRSHVSSQY